MKFSILLFSFILVQICPALAVTTEKNEKPVEMRFRIVHGPSSIIAEPLQQFKKEVEEGTNKRVTIKIISPKTDLENELFAAKKAYAAVKAGKLDMTQVHAFYLGEDVPDFNVLDRPFTFQDHEHAFQVVDGPIGNEMFKKLEAKNGIKGLAFTYSGGYRFVATKAKKIQKLEDLKGLELARRMSPADYLLLTALGAKINKNKKHAGKDGRVTVYSTYSGSREEKVTPIVNPLNYGLQFTALVISKKAYSQISAKDQEILTAAARRAAVLERTLAIKAQTDIETEYVKRGLQISTLPEDEKLKLKKFSDSMDWTSLKLPADLLEKVQKSTKQNVTQVKE